MYLSIGTRQQAGRREKRNFNYLSEEDLFRTTASTPALGKTQSVVQWAQGAKPPTVKRLGHDAGHSSSYHGEIKTRGAKPSVSHTPTWHIWEGSNRSTTKIIPGLLSNPKAHYHLHNKPSPDHIRRQTNRFTNSKLIFLLSFLVLCPYIPVDYPGWGSTSVLKAKYCRHAFYMTCPRYPPCRFKITESDSR